MASAQNLTANAQTEVAYAQVAMVNAEISRLKIDNDKIEARVDTMLRHLQLRSQHELGMKQIEATKAAKVSKE
jgi:hypothetical protein